eukprot:365039-Chlamydomonas_euryale.AAC.3
MPTSYPLGSWACSAALPGRTENSCMHHAAAPTVATSAIAIAHDPALAFAPSHVRSTPGRAACALSWAGLRALHPGQGCVDHPRLGCVRHDGTVA